MAIRCNERLIYNKWKKKKKKKNNENIDPDS